MGRGIERAVARRGAGLRGRRKTRRMRTRCDGDEEEVERKGGKGGY